MLAAQPFEASEPAMLRYQANALLFFAAFCWGIGNVAQKTVLDDLGPMVAMGLRSLIAALVIAPLVWREAKASSLRSDEFWQALARVSVVFVLALATQQSAYGGTSVTNASFLVNTTVVFTPVLAWLMMRERADLVLVPSIGLAISGILLMGGGLYALRWGDAMCIVSALLYSIWIVLVADAMRKFERPFAIAGCQFALAAIVGISSGLAIEGVSVQALGGAAPELAVLGIVSTGIPYTLQAIAQRHTPPSHAAIIMSAESIFGAAAAAIFLSEQMGVMNGIGAMMIMASIGLIQLPARSWPGKRAARLAHPTYDA